VVNQFRWSRLIALSLLVLLIAVSGASGSAQAAGAYDEVVFEGSEATVGPGTDTIDESNKFKLVNGGISWPAGSTVEYTMGGLPVQFQSAVLAAVATLSSHMPGTEFVWNEDTTQLNPCTGQANSITWVSADGAGGVLASAAACFNTASKDISGFRMAFDLNEPWATDGNANSVDFQGVATHEMGHVVGIDHTNAPASSCLTMYKFSSLGETQKRTLGLGDKLGMDKLYGGGDITPGPGCNN
jgi:hypothetical protein